jgi:1-pyrroline-5-carboxylate dehydrogenase
MFGPFRNEPLTDFNEPAHKAAMANALGRLEAEAKSAKPQPLVIGGKPTKTGETFQTFNPAHPAQALAEFCKAGAKEARAAIAAADKAFPAWAAEPMQKRAELLLRTAEKMRQYKFELIATMVLEAGKNWVEADADVAEAIDFCEYYARQAMTWARGMDVAYYPGERNETFYVPIGVVSVIPPWNFPCAILTGMTVAALVAGNTVCLKPSSDTPLIGWKVAQILFEAGAPAGVLNFVPGPGATCGEELVVNPRVRAICFTGSKEVGLGIVEKAAKHQRGQIWIKRVIAEMGGKDTLIVDETADLDKAAMAAVTSAFGYQGQKCSACSRVVVVEDVHDAFVEKLLAQAAKITVGPVVDPNNYMGPVINEASRKKILEYIALGRKGGKVVHGGKAVDLDGGWFVEPTIVDNVKPGSPLDQEEIFGPVLAIVRARDFDHALALANATEFGLTGGLISARRDRIERARREFHVGNLYVNRKITGALVGVQPFGGFNMSGTDSKAGGADYLGLFLQAKSYTERF